jgi:hypothetical protein
MSTIKFFVIEDGEPFSISQMSEPEGYSIGLCVKKLLPNTNSEDYWFDVDTCLFDEDEVEPEFGLLRCYKDNPNEGVFESRIPHPIPKKILDSLHGKTFRVYPKQYGLSPWGKKVEIRFESLPKEGVKASELIAAALKTQKVN